MGDSDRLQARASPIMRDKALMDRMLHQEAAEGRHRRGRCQGYDEAVEAMRAEQEVHARHILVTTEDEAKAIDARSSKGGADFAKLAKEKSTDPARRERRRPRLVHQGADGAGIRRRRLRARKGKISEPVKSQFGWHIIKVEDKRTQAAADLRAGQGPVADLRRPQVANRPS